VRTVAIGELSTQRRPGCQHARKKIFAEIERTGRVDPRAQALAAHDIERRVDEVGQPRVRRMGVSVESENAPRFVNFDEV